MTIPDPVLSQKAVTPPGNIPKGRQQYIMIGIAVVIVGGILLTDSRTPKAKAPANLPAVNVAPASKVQIDRYTQELADQQARAKAAEIEAARATATFRQNQAVPGAASSSTAGQIPGQALVAADGRTYYPAQPGTGYGLTSPAPQLSPEQEDKKKREYGSLFASNVALSFRRSEAADLKPASSAPVVKTEPEESQATGHAAALIQRKAPTHLVFEGTILEAVLTNRLEGGFSGLVNCQVTTALYSHDRNTLLVPQGSRVLGESRRITDQQQERLAIVFHRLIMPDGFSVSLDQMPGLDQAGATGLKDKTNNHHLSIFGTSIALGVLSGFSQFGTGSALTANGFDQYRQGVASQVSQNNSTVLQRQLNRLPSITIREGHRVKIYLTQDLSFPAYSQHPERGEL